MSAKLSPAQIKVLEKVTAGRYPATGAAWKSVQILMEKGLLRKSEDEFSGSFGYEVTDEGRAVLTANKESK